MNILKLGLSTMLGFVCIGIMLQSCSNMGPGIYQNQKIAPGKLEKFHELDDLLFDAVKANKPREVENIMSREMLDDGGNNRTIELISNQCHLGGYKILDEFYMLNTRAGTGYQTSSVTQAGGPYTIKCKALVKEMYMAFMVPKTIGDEYVVTAVFSKYDYGWRLSRLELGPYTIEGKTAPQLYKLARQLYEKNYLVDAVNTMKLTGKCLRPSPFWEYDQAGEISNFYGKVIEAANAAYKYPLVINQVPTHPQIFRITTETNNEGLFPAIYYLSGINITDTAALKKENAAISKVIGQVLPGIDKDKKYLLYSAFNQKPQPYKNIPYYAITVKLQ